VANVGFIGLGNMGMPMACRLSAAGHRVRCYDVSAAALERAEARGLTPSVDIHSTVQDADFVVSMLPSGRDVLAVFGERSEGSTLPLREGCVVIDSSTIDVNSCASFHRSMVARRLLAVDAPVSGGVEGAAAGTLTFMVGGSQAAFDAALPVLDVMGKKIVHAGDASAGQIAKICNNMIAGISMIAVSEALTLAQRLGLDATKLFEISSVSSGQCWALTSYAPVPGLVPTAPSNRAYQGGFASELMLKDLRLAEQAAIGSGTPTLLGAAAAALYGMHCKTGRGRLDFSSIVQMLNESERS
jgi:3-hydroxyisobutyrate dehydrogenase